MGVGVTRPAYVSALASHLSHLFSKVLFLNILAEKTGRAGLYVASCGLVHSVMVRALYLRLEGHGLVSLSGFTLGKLLMMPCGCEGMASH